jgi:hypothetical protein
MPTPASLDPVASKFIEEVAKGATSVPDAIAGLLLRLCGRVASLEAATKKYRLDIDKLQKQPRYALTAPQAVIERELTGIDIRDGSPVHIVPKRPPGRPKGVKDSRPRRRHSMEYEDNSRLIDADWDDLKG